MAKTTERVRYAADTAKPYVDRALHDDELRDSVKRAFQAARDVYDDVVGPRNVVGIAQRLATDEDVQQNLRTTAAELRRAAERLREQETHRARNTFFILVGITIGILFNPWTGPETRGWLKDVFFGGGAEEEFGYPPTSENGGTTPAAAE